MKNYLKETGIKHRSIPMKSRILQPHGAREMTRRKAQIANGQLKPENGLIK